MRIARIAAGILCLLLAVGELLPIYLIGTNLLQGQEGGAFAYFRFVGHIVLAVALVVVSVRFIRSSRSSP